MTNPLCPKCGHKMAKHGKYGKENEQRYICKNKDCSVKTISSSTLINTENSDYYTKLFAIIAKLVNEDKIEEQITNDMKISSASINKLVRKLLEHNTNTKAEDKYMTSFYMSKEFHMQLIYAFRGKIPIVTFFPDVKNQEVICCISKEFESSDFSYEQFLKARGLIKKSFDFDTLQKLHQYGKEFFELEEYVWEKLKNKQVKSKIKKQTRNKTENYSKK